MCVWVEDADKLDMNSPELAIVFCNRRVHNFLNGKDTLGISATKGQGKTFLIKVKRKKIESNCPFCIPKDMPVDTVDSALFIDPSLGKLVADYHSWVKLWKAALCITIIKYVEASIPGEDIVFEDKLNASTRMLLNRKNAKAQPSVILNAMLQMNIKECLAVFEDIPSLASIVSGINKSIFVFIDKVDQGFSSFTKNYNKESIAPQRSRNASIWQYSQFGLAEAAYDIYCIGTHHIKVYFTIRQEALIDCEKLNKDKARNILPYISNLLYSKADLEEMYHLYISNEKDANLLQKECKDESPSMAFLGIDKIEHGYIKDVSEPVFDYIYRHTLQRPYDIMRICRALYLESAALNIESIRHIINHESNLIFQLYMQELSDFVPINVEVILAMAKMINSNILTITYMQEVCAILNKEQESAWSCNNVCHLCKNLQPFSILYNLGLIGVCKKNPADVMPIQRFQNIGNSILGLNAHNLSESDYYFVHPALANYARDSRYILGMNYWSSKAYIIGDGYPFDPRSKNALRPFINRSIDQLKKEKIFISSTIHDLSDTRRIVSKTLEVRGFHTYLSEMPDFDLADAQLAHSHDHCIDELLKCKSVVFLIGENYGGIYKGDKYIRERDEIIAEAQKAGKIIQPSISLMEFYVARKKNLTCYAFISKELENRVYNRLDASIDEKIRNEVQFINHMRKGTSVRGNWISAYSDSDELAARVNSIKFFTRR